ncbi:HEPN domain-containing protein [Methylophaga sp. OBS4]|uniref:HEPN domain-containing protein n=1 Tax=Methylophaga sp. OBS4 TaxID=2991935 RepID=UPI00224DBBEB|nr:HEPN domain-containing protein [Methylophaga sp. OBS4]MCX4188150.1 HEPN domain-containing protein [Methylophaga sp. OBS4]
MLQIKLPTNEKEFIAMMEVVDSFLREQEIPIHARPMRGWFEISKTLKLGLSLFPRENRPAADGVYTGDDLTIRIFSWFDERYGNKLAVRMGPGRGAIMVRGDLWEVHFPKIYGTVEFFISANERSSNQGEDLKLKRIPRCNILDVITDFPVGLARSLSSGELRTIADSFIAGYHSMDSISKVQKSPMVSEILSDIDSAVNHLLSSPPHYGLSKWSSLQTVEKSFKTFLAIKGIDFPKHHQLHELSRLSKENGLFAVEKSLIDKIQCSAGVRYGDEKVSKEEAYEAHLLSVVLGGDIAKSIDSLTSA